MAGQEAGTWWGKRYEAAKEGLKEGGEGLEEVSAGADREQQ